jgi:hypothetical protein
MKISQVKARIASLLEMSTSDIILRKEKDATPSFEQKGNKLYITYSESGTLVHEFLHACFTPRNFIPDILLNALEDHRVSVKAQQYDKHLAKANDEIMSDEELLTLMHTIKGKDKVSDSLRVMTALALPETTKIPIEETLKEVLKHSWTPATEDVIIGKVKSARTLISKFKDFHTVTEWWRELKPYLEFPKGEKEGAPGYAIPKESNEDEVEGAAKEHLKKKLSEKEVPRLSAQDEFVLKKGLKKIIQNRAIEKTHNSIDGKLASKRLGRFPSTYLFKQKTRPSPETKLYIMADLSGSMLRGKLHAMQSFLNTLRELKINNLEVHLRGFNTELFKDHEIPKDIHDLEFSCIHKINNDIREEYGGYNDDAHFLKEIVQEIHQDPCTNKSLLILSDGRPAPCGQYKEKDLSKSVREHLIPSGIPYMSIGIMDNSVNQYYPKAKVADSTTELVKLLSKYSRELVKF